MDLKSEKTKLIEKETLTRPNTAVAPLLSAVVIVIFVVVILNQLDIFELKQSLVNASFVITLILYLWAMMVIKTPKFNTNPKSKYVIMGIVTFTVLELSILLNVNVVMTLALPLMMVPQYRSRKLTNLTVVCSYAICILGPVLAYFLGTWNLKFLQGYLETTTKLQIIGFTMGSFTDAQAVGRILLYFALPQCMIMTAFSVIANTMTANACDSTRDQLKIMDMSDDIIYSMSDIIESRDGSTGDHVRRTSEVVRLIVEEMRKDPDYEISDWFCNAVVKASPMHDIGKIAINDAILQKPGKLTPEEYEIIKTHAAKSAELIKKVFTGFEDEDFLHLAKNLARHHHERYDGKGYPDGLEGEEIPLEARIMAIADVYDALISTRCYKKSMSSKEAFRIIEESMGAQFDPALNKYFVAARPQIEKYYK